VVRLLLSHQWKSFWRSRNAGKNLVIQFFVAFITIYILAVAIGVGFFLVELIKRFRPGEDEVKVFCGFILYYFSFDILTRFLIQELPTLSILPYLILNIKRKQLIRFLNVRSLFTILNILPLVLFLPFTLIVISRSYGPAAAAGLIISVLFLTVFNHFLILYIKRKTILNSWWFAGFFIIVAAFAAADYYKIFSISSISEKLFLYFLEIPSLSLCTVALAIAAFINNYRFLYRNLYLEDITLKSRKKESANWTFLSRFGTIGELIAVDLKLLLRNKRPRSIVLLTAVFLFYGLIFYKEQYIQGNEWGMLLMGGIFLTGLFIGNYGQFLFAWQSCHFDGLMTGHLQVHSYIKSKFTLFTAVCTIILALTSIYGFLSWKLLVVQLAGYFYNIGIHSVIAVYFATYSYKGIDLSKGSSFNYQGIGAAQWVYTLIVLLVPLSIFLPFSLLINPFAGVIAIGVFGLVSFFLQDWWIEIITREFKKRKHAILEGFREK
jgi:hypothetical protein